MGRANAAALNARIGSRPLSGDRHAFAALLFVLSVFCIPLFIGLGDADLQSDEAIYSYAVDRILETGDWLTPRFIPFDTPFLEKPPLKFWIVAGAIRAGLLPHDEFGYRFFDALFSSVAFVYVLWLGRSLSGWICGLVAVLVLFTLPSLMFDHGLRTNNMEAALLLAYCGGLFHFARWVEGADSRHQWRHAAAIVAYMTLGFMTKFVAILFLPLVCALAFWWRTPDLANVRFHWKQWAIPSAVAFAVVVPWFLYQALRADGLWTTMWTEQVFTRFTAEVDPRRALPWHQYFSQTAAELVRAGSHWISGLGLIALGYEAFVARRWLARALLLWLVVPLCLLSLPTEKYYHYAYPFLPPAALGAGAVAAMIVQRLERLATLATGALARNVPRISRWPWRSEAGCQEAWSRSPAW